MVLAAGQYLETLTLPPAEFEVYCGDAWKTDPWVTALLAGIQVVWPGFLQVAGEQRVLDTLGLRAQDQQWEIELGFVSDPEIRELNRQYREKDEATDVLSFTLLADADDPAAWTRLPQVQLGSLFISLDWAKAHAAPDAPDRYVLTRFIHGMLHLCGQHHDTMTDYEKVVAIQNRVLEVAGYGA